MIDQDVLVRTTKAVLRLTAEITAMMKMAFSSQQSNLQEHHGLQRPELAMTKDYLQSIAAVAGHL